MKATTRQDQAPRHQLHVAVALALEAVGRLGRREHGEARDPEEREQAGDPEVGEHLEVDVVGHMRDVDDEVGAREVADPLDVVDGRLLEVARSRRR